MTTEKILITGITGQDGIFLSTVLLQSSKNIEIFGTSRSSNNTIFYKRLEQFLALDDLNKIKIVNIDLLDELEVKKFLEFNKFNKIIHLSGPSSVYSSYQDPIKYKNLIIKQFDNLIDSCINLNIYPAFFQASSSEIFSTHAELPLNEKSSMLPRSPYSEAKFEIHNKIQELKNSQNWNIKSGIMFNHESEFRPNEFLIMKIITTALSIKRGKAKKLVIGSIDYKRDWTHAFDTANAISKIIFEEKPIDYVIGSGKTNSVLELIELVFSFLNLKYEDFLTIDHSLLREGDPKEIVSNPILIHKNLGWASKIDFEDMVIRILDYKINNS